MNYRKYLTQNILPFWLSNAFDTENDGMFYSLDKNGNVTDFNKNISFMGRALWTFATVYNTLDAKPEYLSACRSLHNFIKKCVLPDGKLPFVTDKSGNALETRKLFHEEAHAAMGCAAYYKACKDEEVKNDALKFFDITYNMYMTDDARKETTKDGAERYIFGRDMFVLSVAQAMRCGGINSPKIDSLAKRSIENIANTGYINDSLKIVNEYVGANGEIFDYSCYGHLFEAVWFLLYEGEIKKNDEAKKLGKKILDYSLTREEGSGIDAIVLGSNCRGEEYLWWPQCEAIIAYYMAYHIFKDDLYLKRAKSIEEFAFETFADTKSSEWFSKCDSTGNILDDAKGSMVKGVFHLPRMLMVLISLQEKENITDFM